MFFKPSSLSDQSLLSDKLRLTAENQELKERVASLSAKLNELQARPHVHIDPFMGDVEPLDTENRKAYVAVVAGVYKDYLLPKWKKMIAELLKILESNTNDREFDQSIKGAIYAKREDILWGERMMNEHVAFLSQDDKE